MSNQQVGVSYAVNVALLSSEAGGRDTAVANGYRPLCVVTHGGEQIVVGVCELRLPRELEPGESLDARLVFAPFAEAAARRYLLPGAKFALNEGPKKVGCGVIAAEEATST